MIKKIKIVYCPGYLDWQGSFFVNSSKLPPLGVAQLTAYLRRRGFIVEQDDLNIKIAYDNYNKQVKIDLSCLRNEKKFIAYLKKENNIGFEILTKKILKKSNFEDFDMICLSLPWQDNPVGLHVSLLLAKSLKEKYNIPIVIGGSILSLEIDHIKNLFKFGCKKGIFDFLIQGPGEKSLYKLIKALNKNQKYSNIPGLIYFKKGKLVAQGFGEFIYQEPDFTGLPLELYKFGLSEAITKNLGMANEKILVLPFQFIRGCPNHCIFCGNSLNEQVLAPPPKKVVKSLKKLCDKYNTKYFYFLSTTINISKCYINQLCDEIIKNDLKIYWTDCARFNDLDEETLLKMKKAGCIRLVYGLETASPRMLRYIQKGVTLKQAVKTIKLTDKVGIWAGIEIIAGLPTEKEEDINKTISFLIKYYNNLDKIFVSPFCLSSGSLLKHNPKKYGIENIRKVNKFARINTISYDSFCQSYAYDEINGLSWNKKKNQISHSFKRISQIIEKKPSLNIFDDIHFLFLAYKNFNDKKLIKRKYQAFYNLSEYYNKQNEKRGIQAQNLWEIIKELFNLQYKNFDRNVGKIGFLLEKQHPKLYKKIKRHLFS